MCGVGCNCVSCTFPTAGEPRLLRLDKPLTYIVNSAGIISADSTKHAVLNGAVASTNLADSLKITLHLLLPSCVGCSLIEFTATPTLRLALSTPGGFKSGTATSTRNKNFVIYTVTIPSITESNKNVITEIALSENFGKIALGCGCNQVGEHMGSCASLLLSKSEAIGGD
jgi:hypothetical protein